MTDDRSLEPRTKNASLNSKIHAATEIQSSVTPEDYPAAERADQTAIVGPAKTEKGKRPSE